MLLLILVIVVLSGFQWTIWRIYTTPAAVGNNRNRLFYQDFNEQFEGYTQRQRGRDKYTKGCFIRSSMNNLKDIHNPTRLVLISSALFYQDFNEQFCCKSTKNPWNLQIYMKLFWYFRKKHYLCSNKFEGYTQ